MNAHRYILQDWLGTFQHLAWFLARDHVCPALVSGVGFAAAIPVCVPPIPGCVPVFVQTADEPIESLSYKKTHVHHPFQMQRRHRKCRQLKSMSEVQPIRMGLISDCLSACFCSRKWWASLTAKCGVYILLASDLSNLEASDFCFLVSF